MAAAQRARPKQSVWDLHAPLCCLTASGHPLFARMVYSHAMPASRNARNQVLRRPAKLLLTPNVNSLYTNINTKCVIRTIQSTDYVFRFKETVWIFPS